MSQVNNATGPSGIPLSNSSHAFSSGDISKPLADRVIFVPMYIHLILSAVFPIFTGAFASLSRPSSAAKPSKLSRRAHERDDDDDEERPRVMEGLRSEDAIIFPITAGIVLVGLYFLIQRFGADLINFFMTWYFSIVGVWSVGQFINDALSVAWDFALPEYYQDSKKVWKVSVAQHQTMGISQDGGIENVSSRSSPLPGFLARLPLPKFVESFFWRQLEALKQKYIVNYGAKRLGESSLTITRHNVASAVLGIAVVVYANFIADSWYLTNLQGFAVSYGALQLLSPTSFVTGSLLLSALFCYDIWAVFFTPYMVGVAKNLNVPIKLVFPRPDEAKSFSMLGLGDIVIPGIMIAMALRWDLHLFYLYKQKPGPKPSSDDGKDEPSDKAPYVTVTGSWGTRFFTWGANASLLPDRLTTTFSKPYFTASLIGYVLGLVATLVGMNISNHAQPALLYLVPAVLASLWGTGLARGELEAMLEWSEGLELDAADLDKSETPKAEERPDGGFLENFSFANTWLDGVFGLKSSKNEAVSSSDPEQAADQKKKTSTPEPDLRVKEHRSKKADTYKDLVLYITVKRQPVKSAKVD